ncbi:hypothetical protein NDU88_002262 [Pleurodeles waltl]|uniref:Uncharacterized protein n=1 Tax=Pleurodeles waltl TaxID=8319 RepID=A0AAV7WRT9_PLEWA|nr:hypothetical protein NDU88_002262 [Pleurodeles waltl]
MALEDAWGKGGGSRPLTELSLRTIMAAIQDLNGSLDPKLDAVIVDATLLHAGLKKVAEEVTTAEIDITHLQSTSKRLEDQAARSRGDLQYEKTIIRFFLDFTLKVQR